MSNAPIGILDSGLGGLTVAKAISEALPSESFIYLGDTARIPYGTRTPQTIKKFALELVSYLLAQKVKCLVVACNTISAIALPEIEKISPVPIVNVIDPTVALVIENKYSRVGIIGTTASINSHVYLQKLKAIQPKIEVFEKACPLFVPLIEEGFENHPVTEMIAREYLSSLKTENLDALVLGCTHYPLIKSTIAKVINNNTTIIDSATPTAQSLARLLEEKKLLSKTKDKRYKFLLTDNVEKSQPVVSHFWPESLTSNWRKIDL